MFFAKKQVFLHRFRLGNIPFWAFKPVLKKDKSLFLSDYLFSNSILLNNEAKKRLMS